MATLQFTVVLMCSFFVAMTYKDGPLSNTLAVEIDGDADIADQLAKKHGFLNLGLVGNLEGVYHFVLPVEEVKDIEQKAKALLAEIHVINVRLQPYRQMTPKKTRHLYF